MNSSKHVMIDSDPTNGPAVEAADRIAPALRIWPAVILVVALWCLRIVPSLLADASMPVVMTMFMGPLVCAGLILLWWALLSRATWQERIGGLVGIVCIAGVTSQLVDRSLAGFGVLVHLAPWGVTAFAVGAILFGRVPSTRRTWLALAVAVIGFGYWDLVRTDEIRGDFASKHSWRWQPTAEQRFLARRAAGEADHGEPAGDDLEPAADWSAPEWPAFRGANRRGVQPGVALAANWIETPPTEVWRISVGPAWSSFSVAGSRLFTQEQRGEEEVVVCYDASTGRERWSHGSESRFWEVIAGAGPRATPTLADGRVFALGANGLLHCLDPIDGSVVWANDIAKDADRDPPTWGFASSPLVTAGAVIVHAGGEGDLGILAYDQESGERLWGAPAGDHSYSSPQLAEIDGKTCVLMLSNQGLAIVDPADGTLLGNHLWPNEYYRVVQPLVIDDNSVLLGTAMGGGTQRIALTWSADKFSTDETWTSRRMSPYYNDYVAHQGYLYGFDNNIFACIDLKDGARKWKRGRYGNGQVLLLPDADQLLVTSEDGELVLLEATPEGRHELAQLRVLEGRTWNHPVLVGARLFVRNAEQAACYEMPLEQGVE